MLMVGTFILSWEVLDLKSMLNNKTCKTKTTIFAKHVEQTKHGYTYNDIGCKIDTKKQT